jgi:hypothetical protein
VLYRVLATAVDGSGPVLASNMPGTYADTPGYPLAFQARSLKRTGERVKIERNSVTYDFRPRLEALKAIRPGDPWPPLS